MKPAQVLLYIVVDGVAAHATGAFLNARRLRTQCRSEQPANYVTVPVFWTKTRRNWDSDRQRAVLVDTRLLSCTCYSVTLDAGHACPCVTSPGARLHTYYRSLTRYQPSSIVRIYSHNRRDSLCSLCVAKNTLLTIGTSVDLRVVVGVVQCFANRKHRSLC